MDKDFIKEIGYVVIAVIAFVIKYYKDKKDAKKNAENQTIKITEVARQIAESQATAAKAEADRLRGELAETARRLAEENAKHLQEREERDIEERAAREVRSGIELNEKVDRDVRHAEGKILNEYNAQRMFVIHFSNGTETEAGIHLMKVTFKSEIVERFDVEPLARYFNEKPVPEMFKSPMTKVLKGADYYIQDIDEINREKELNRKEHYDWLCAYKVKSILWTPIRKRNSSTVCAILVVHWFAKTHLEPKEIARLKDMANEIEKIYSVMQSPPKR